MGAWVMGHCLLDLWFESCLRCVFVAGSAFSFLFFGAGGLGVAMGLGFSSIAYSVEAFGDVSRWGPVQLASAVPSWGRADCFSLT